MAREWRRLLVAPERLVAGAAALPLEPQEAHYLRRVLRLRAGDAFAVVNGRGQLWGARLELPAGAAPRAVLEQDLAHPLLQAPPPRPQLALAVALPRLDADVLLRMACELGVDRLQVLRAARSVAADRLRPERREAILREAVEQCERLWLPQLDPEQEAQRWLGAPPPAAASPADGSGPGVIRLLASSRQEGLPLLEDALPAAGAEPVWVAIGPEGGWTPEEEAAAIAAGWQPVSLGSTILRCSTAAVVAAAAMVSWRRRLSS
jgi:16S rRNA (uracil1498-N3)-methyltransferase